MQKNDQIPDRKNKNGSAEGSIDSPLSDLEQTIPIEPAAIRVTKPLTRSDKLQLTSRQSTNIMLIESLEEDLVPNGGSTKTPAVSGWKTLRIFTGLAIFLTIILAVSLDIPSIPGPEVITETSNFNQYIESLPGEAPVLIAFEYQPGYSGELDSAMMATLDQLMARNAYISTISSTPTGVLQAERVIRIAAENSNRIYQAPSNYINLGFVPGGAIGINSLSTGLRSTIPQAVGGGTAWDQPPLREVSSISDFNLVIVAADSAESGRDWIEQVEPNLPTTPMLMIVSSQAEPMLRPYYESLPRQIDGILVGLPGSTAYENLTGRRIDAATRLWPAYSISVLVSAGIILVGGLVSATLAASKDTDLNDGAG